MKGKKIMTKRFGFTLAEVLITLGIIGVVAAMTIPTLMNATGSAEFKTGFKKSISAFNQAVTLNLALADTDFSTLTASNFATDGSIANMFLTRMNVISTASAAVSAAAGDIDNGIAATSPPVTAAGNYAVFLNDGMAIGWDKTAASCLESNWQTNKCMAVIDVNGAKKPNKLTVCGAAALTDGGTACTKANLAIGDRFSVRFYGNQVTPNGNAARYVMYN